MTPPSAGDRRDIIRASVHRAARDAGFGDVVPEPGRIPVELPREFAHGDLATPVAFGLAKSLRRPPAEVAEALRSRIADPDVASVAVAGGGYLNFHFADSVWAGVLAQIAAQGAAYGEGRALAGERILVEFVSANPTGPLLVVNARAAAWGDALCRVLAAEGAVVAREYYVNDAGAQVRHLARSVEARWREALGQPAAIPEDGYHGEYVRDLAAALRARLGDGVLDAPEADRLETLRREAVAGMLARQRDDLGRLGVRFDGWVSEREALHETGLVGAALEALRASGETFEADGAVWFRATKFGDEKDRVLVKQDGQPTYTLPDVAYHRHKFARGYTRLIDIVGIDHQVEMATLRAALGAAGEPADRLEVIFTQFVTLKRGGEKVKMSKRAGDVVPLAELVEEVGADVARFFFLLRTLNSPLEFDVDLAKRQSQDNPVYYLQYAHARLCSVMAKAAQAGVTAADRFDAAIAHLGDPESRLVLRQLVRWPLVVEKAALGRSPHLLTHELLELAQAVHQFYTRHRVVGAETPAAAAARLVLVAAARQAIANGLGLLGVSAPERMDTKDRTED